MLYESLESPYRTIFSAYTQETVDPTVLSVLWFISGFHSCHIWTYLAFKKLTLKALISFALFLRNDKIWKDDVLFVLSLFIPDITKTYLYNFDPLRPHFYIVKLGITVIYIIFLISTQKHRLWYSFEPSRRGGSNEYPQSMFFLAEIWKISDFFIWTFSIFGGKISVYFE